MIKLFATDLDGTLLKDHLYIEQDNVLAIQSLYNRGIEVTFATGRTDQDIVHLFQQLNINGHRVSQNGAFVINKANQTIFKQLFSKKISEILYEQIKAYPTYYFVSTEDEVLFDQEIPIIDELQGLFNHRLIQTEQLLDQIKNELDVAKYMLLGEPEQLLLIQAELNEVFKGEVSSVLSAPKCIDVMPTGVNKRVGLTHLIKTLAINPTEIAVIGDSQNDIEMLKMTPHSYAMSSADHDVKQAAQHIVDHVFEAIKHLESQNLLPTTR